MKKLYTPKQIFITTFLGTIIGATYCLNKNNEILGQDDKNKIVVPLCSLLLVFTVFPLYFLPDDIRVGKNGPALFDVLFLLFYLVLCYGAALYAVKKQLSKRLINESPKYECQPNWKVAVVCALSFLAFIVFNVIFVSIFEYLNLTHL